MTTRRPRRLDAVFVRKVDQPGRYGDGRGGFGLSLLVQITGRGVIKSWTQRVVQRNGRDTSIGLGGHPAVSLSDAREAAARNALMVRAGQDILSERQRSVATGMTFAEAAERAIQSHSMAWKNGKTAQVWHAMLSSYVYPSIGNMPISAVTSADVFGVLSPVLQSKPAIGAKIKTQLNTVFAWAAAHDLVTTNPLLAVGRALPKTAGKVQHHKALPWQEVPAMLATVDASSAAETTKLCIRLLALTAARSGEVRGATWDEFDGDVWVIPPSRMKEGKAHRVPLSEAALAVLERAWELTGGQGLVFPSWTGRSITPGALSKLFADLGIACVPHGLRSTFRVWAAEAGVSWDVAEHALAHVTGTQSERAYMRSDLFEQRAEVMQRWATAIS